MTIETSLDRIAVALEKLSTPPVSAAISPPEETGVISKADPPDEPETVVSFTIEDLRESLKPFIPADVKHLAYDILRECLGLEPDAPDPKVVDVPASAYATVIPALRAAAP